MNKPFYAVIFCCISLLLSFSSQAHKIEWRSDHTQQWQPFIDSNIFLAANHSMEIQITPYQDSYLAFSNHKLAFTDIGLSDAKLVTVGFNRMYWLKKKHIYQFKLSSYTDVNSQLKLYSATNALIQQKWQTWLWSMLFTIVVILALYALLSSRWWQGISHFWFLLLALNLIVFLGFEANLWSRIIALDVYNTDAEWLFIASLLLMLSFVGLHKHILSEQLKKKWLMQSLNGVMCLIVLLAVFLPFLPFLIAYHITHSFILVTLLFCFALSLLVKPDKISVVSYSGYQASWALISLLWTLAYIGSLFYYEIPQHWLSGSNVLHAFVMLLVLNEWRVQRIKQELAYAQNRRQAQDSYAYLTWHDKQTGLPNQLALEKNFNYLTHAKPKNTLAVVIFKLKQFDQLNQTLGFSTGDIVLLQTAKRLNQYLAKYPEVCLLKVEGENKDVIAALSGTRFAFLVAVEQQQHLIEKIAHELPKVLPDPIVLDSYVVDINGVLGIAKYPIDGSSLDVLLRNAHTALDYAIKQSKAVEFFDMRYEENSQAQREMLVDLKQAIDKQELSLHVQPIFDLAKQQVMAAEALLRWRHPVKGMIQPLTFLALAEKSGVIYSLTRWVLTQAITEAALWQSSAPNVAVSVNLSSRDLLQHELIDFISLQLQEQKLPAKLLKLEIKESALVDEPQQAHDVISRLNDLGVKVVIDDFGSGLSSLAVVRQLPITALKIDSSSVASLMAGDRARTIVGLVIDIGRNLQLDVIAEGVEDKDTELKLAELGCTQAQGFLYSKPFNIEGFGSWYQSWKMQ